MRFFIFLKTFLLIATLANACEEFDLNKSADSPLRKIPIYDQDGSGLCYAYTAAQAVDYYRFKNGDNGYGLTDPTYASWKYALTNDVTTVRGGDIDKTIEALRKAGTCSASDVQKAFEKAHEESGLTEAQIIAFFGQLKKPEVGFPEIREEVQCSIQGQRSLIRFLLRNDLAKETELNFLNNMYGSCKVHPVKVPRAKVVDGDDNEIKSFFEKSLRSSNPVMISYCANMLYSEPAKQRVKKNGKGRAIVDPKDCEGHGSLVTAQAYVNGSCRLLIRNSYGTDWKGNNGNWCACINQSGDYQQHCMRWEAKEYVGCWYDKEDVAKNTFKASVLE